jgi:serine/threonine protein kinase
VLVGGDERVQLLGVGLAAGRTASPVAAVARYRAPEQIGASRGATDARSDVFALGALLFELVNGEPAFAGATLDEVRAAMTAGPPVSIGFRFDGSGGALPEPLERALRNALEPDPSRRWRNVAELERCLVELVELVERLDRLEPGRTKTAARPTAASAAPSRTGALAAGPPVAERTQRIRGDGPTGGASPSLAQRRRELAHVTGGTPLALWLVPAALLLALVALLLLWAR